MTEKKQMVQINQDEARELLRSYVQSRGSLRKALRDLDLDISVTFLADVLNGKSPVSDKIARKLGYTKRVVYERVK